jgi:hypothetical protein
MHQYKSFSDVLPIELIGWIDLELTVGGPLPRHGKDWSPENPLRPALSSGAGESEVVAAGNFWDEIAFFRHKLGFREGQNGIVINGRVRATSLAFRRSVNSSSPPSRRSSGPSPTALSSTLIFKLCSSTRSRSASTTLCRPSTAPLLISTASVGASLLLHFLFSLFSDLSSVTSYQRSHIINVASSVVGVASLPDAAAGAFGGGAVERRRDYLHLHDHHSCVLPPLSLTPY